MLVFVLTMMLLLILQSFISLKFYFAPTNTLGDNGINNNGKVFFAVTPCISFT